MMDDASGTVCATKNGYFCIRKSRPSIENLIPDIDSRYLSDVVYIFAFLNIISFHVSIFIFQFY